MKIIPLNALEHYLQRLVEARLWVKVLIALILGLGAGVLISPGTGLMSEELSRSIGSWLALPGKLFLKLVQMIMIPLIFTSIISGIVSNSNGQLKTMGLRLLLYFVATTAISIVIGVALAMIFEPGTYFHSAGAFQMPDGDSLQNGNSSAPFSDIPGAISDLLPENPLASMVTGEMLSVVIFTVIIGVAVTQLSDKTVSPILKMLHAIQEICMTVVGWAMRLVPYAVFGLIAQLTSSVGLESLAGLGIFVLVVLLGLLLLLIVYMLLVGLVGQKNPFSFLRKIRDVQLLAFSTTSSAAVMPLSMKTADEELGVSSNISDFVVPIGATINMDGTAIFQCIATLFIAQVYGMELTMINVALIMVTIVAASIGTPAIPGGGVVVLASVLQSAGIPPDGLVIIVGVDRILGMFRTAVNVTGDMAACVVFNRWMGNGSAASQEIVNTETA